MSTTEPPEEMVEAAARAMFEVSGPGDWTWDDVLREEPDRAEVWRGDARSVLRAALAVAPAPSDDDREALASELYRLLRPEGIDNPWDEVKGFRTIERFYDQRSGPNHLIDWAIDYARRGRTVAVGAMLLALKELLAAEVVSSVEELDALGDRAVVLDRDGDVWQRRGQWWRSADSRSNGSAYLRRWAPFRVLLRPDREEKP